MLSKAQILNRKSDMENSQLTHITPCNLTVYKIVEIFSTIQAKLFNQIAIIVFCCYIRVFKRPYKLSYELSEKRVDHCHHHHIEYTQLQLSMKFFFTFNEIIVALSFIYIDVSYAACKRCENK